MVDRGQTNQTVFSRLGQATKEYLLKLASNAGKLFESSEIHEKRLLLKMALQNLEIKGKKALYDWINPFNKIAFYASRQAWLPIQIPLKLLRLFYQI